jgi:hypothetical protein
MATVSKWPADGALGKNLPAERRELYQRVPVNDGTNQAY